MKPYEFKRFYHPKLGRFVFQHKGSGLIVDNIFKPLKSVASSVFKKFAKPIAKKALESGVSHAGDRLGKAIREVRRPNNEKIGKFKKRSYNTKGNCSILTYETAR